MAGKIEDVDQKDEEGLPPLMLAAGYSENPAVISLLLQAGAETARLTDKNAWWFWKTKTVVPIKDKIFSHGGLFDAAED